MRELLFTPHFDRLFRNLSQDTQERAYEKLALYLQDAAHPSLRVKRIKGSPGIWEMSITMSIRITFQVEGDKVLLRRIGTHEILRRP
jgi:mRNA-degrading endonuclease YafQ of YafQ-DinJ toxin-antitoxin module